MVKLTIVISGWHSISKVVTFSRELLEKQSSTPTILGIWNNNINFLMSPSEPCNAGNCAGGMTVAS